MNDEDDVLLQPAVTKRLELPIRKGNTVFKKKMNGNTYIMGKRTSLKYFMQRYKQIKCTHTFIDILFCKCIRYTEDHKKEQLDECQKGNKIGKKRKRDTRWKKVIFGRHSSLSLSLSLSSRFG